jgi:UDP:flavonoid glycosyltransferase YjiC (YdhE family)
LLSTIGSHGDVHPFVGFGQALQRRGHEAILITNGYFESLARSAGLPFVALGSADEFREMLKDPDLWNAMRAFDAVFMRGVMPYLKQVHDTIADQIQPGNTIVVASSLALGARILAEHVDVPLATVHLAPCILRTVYDVPKLPGLVMPGWWPKWFKRLVWKFGDAVVVDRKIAPGINEFRATFGLPPVKGILKDWWHSPQIVIGMWPDWFMPPQPDWPKQLRTAGFPLYDETGITPLDAELSRWLDAGSPPVAFTPGSAMIRGEDFFGASAGACAKLNRRGILLTRHAEQIPANLPPGVRHVSYAPFGQLLPRCAALVHHGGIGTTSQALRAGCPQLIMPMAHDQFDNAHRISQLGVGRSIALKNYRSESVAESLRQLLDNPALSDAAKSVAKRFEGINGLEAACDILQAFADKRLKANRAAPAESAASKI